VYGSLTSDPFCGGVHDDVCAVINRPTEVASCTKRIVDDDGNASFVRNPRNRLKVGHIVLGISNALDLPIVSPY
jgi:hypothetical protein